MLYGTVLQHDNARRVTQLQNTKWLNFFLDEKSVKIINCDMNQLQNETWWPWFLVEFLNNSTANQICEFFFSPSFFELYTIKQESLMTVGS